MVCPLICKKAHRQRSNYRCVFFIVYLLKYITKIIKANTIIVSTTKANKSKYIISNKTASIIAHLHSKGQAFICKVADHICLFSFSAIFILHHYYCSVYNISKIFNYRITSTKIKINTTYYELLSIVSFNSFFSLNNVTTYFSLPSLFLS